MAIKKSALYSSLWAGCDELRGGMDASQYKDYVLFMLFIKYISDKYANSDDFAPPVIIPEGSSFADMVKLKGKSDIGDKINTQIIQPLIESNQRLARSDFPDFNDPNKLGEGKAMVDRLTNLISIFQKPELNFAKNRAEHDDILGDAYEYLMRHFAQESGKSKGQFYTPSEVSRIMAQVIGIAPDNTKAATTAYDPTCGSGSLLLKVAAEAGKHITLEGQEKDVTTAGLARMNMILHDFPTANIVQGNTLANPKFKDGEQLRTYDYVVANPPFSDKGWSAGLTPESDPWQRFAWGAPPAKQGDYAYLLHIVRSMNSNGKGAVILPHGVLFRGNAEAVIRKQLVRSGYLKGIIGLPANLFYGTGIPACILVLDKDNAQARKGIFMIDASKGFIKDGNKNRLRERDIHRIVDTFSKQADVPRYARIVPFDEIADAKNDYNLNLPRYIDTSEPEDRHDLHAHMNGGIPERDIDGDATAIPPVPGLAAYWQAFPTLRQRLFRPNGHPGYNELAVEIAAIKPSILEHEEFAAFRSRITALFDDWRERNRPVLKAFGVDRQPKTLITEIGEDLLETFRTAPLLDPYDIYQHLMDYWYETLQDDAYEINADAWVAKPRRVLEEIKTGKKKGQMKDKGWTCDLIPKPYIVARYFAEEQAALDALQAELDTAAAQLTELEEEHSGEDGAFNELDKINKGEVNKRIKEIKGDPEYADDAKILKQWIQLDKRQSELKKQIKDADAALDQLAYQKLPELSEDEIKTLVVDDKWLTALEAAVQSELERVSQKLTGRVQELAERYETSLPQLSGRVDVLSSRVDEHLKLLTGQTRLAGFEGDWQRIKLGEIASFHKGKGLQKNAIKPNGKNRCVHYGELFNKYGTAIYETISRTDEDGDVFVSSANDVLMPTSDVTPKGLAKASCITIDDVVLGGDILIIRADPKVLNGTFLSHIIRMDENQVLKLVTGSTVYHLYATDMRKFEFLLPGISEQDAIVEVLSDIELELAGLEQLLAKTVALKQAMMQELLTGRTRLVEPQKRSAHDFKKEGI